MNAYEAYFGDIDKATKTLINVNVCPKDFGIKDFSNGLTRTRICPKREYVPQICDDCWKQALEQEITDEQYNIK